MAKAPKPGTTRPKEGLPAISLVIDGEKVTVDLATLTLGERRRAKEELKRLSDPDELEVLAASVWVVLRRTQPDVDLLDLLDKLTFGDLADAEPVEVVAKVDDPEA